MSLKFLSLWVISVIFDPTGRNPPENLSGIFTATTIIPQTKAPKQVFPLGAKTIIIGAWLFCVGQRCRDCHIQTLINPAYPTSIISSISMTVITNFVRCYLHGSSWRLQNHRGRRRRLVQTCSMVVEFCLMGDSGDPRAVVDSKGPWIPYRWQLPLIATVENISMHFISWFLHCFPHIVYQIIICDQSPIWQPLLPDLLFIFWMMAAVDYIFYQFMGAIPVNQQVPKHDTEGILLCLRYFSPPLWRRLDRILALHLLTGLKLMEEDDKGW